MARGRQIRPPRAVLENKMPRRRLQRHHIRYSPEWDVELTGQMHRVITTIQNTNASPEQYARITNFIHSIVEEWNRIRLELDTGLQLPKQRRPKIIETIDINTRKLKRDKVDSNK
jgi:hypothetical protein